jgi:hypothetical protein
MALVIRVDSAGLVLLRKTCRLCVVCEMLIANGVEVDHLIDGLTAPRVAGRKYVVLGTLESRTWRQGVSGGVTIDEIVHAMADFKAYMRVDITPRHWSRKSDADE